MAANPYEDLIQAVRAAIAGGWPDTVGNGAYESIEIGRETLERIDQQGKIPYAVFDIDPEPGDNEGSADDWPLTGTVKMIYVERIELMSDIRQKLYNMIDYLYDTPLSAGQVIGVPYPSWSWREPINTYFNNSRKPYVGGTVTFRFVLPVEREPVV